MLPLPPWAIWSAIAHVIFFAGVCGAAIVGEAFSAPNALYGESGILQQSHLFGIVLAMFAIVTAPLAAGMAIIASSFNDSKLIRCLLPSYWSIAGVLAATAAMVYSIQPSNTFSINQPDNVQQLLGGAVFSIAVPFSIVAACVLCSHLRSKEELNPLTWLQASLGEELVGRNAFLVAGGIVALAAAMFMCCILSGVMNFGPCECFR